MTLSNTRTTTTERPTRHSKQLYSLKSDMDLNSDKEERKREYNRLAQREFRRRRKEHLKNLEQAQKEQSSEQSEEIERLRYQNEELRRENEALRVQMYGSASSSSHLTSSSMTVPSLSSETRQYSLSPSISGMSISGTGSPPATMGADMMTMAALPMSSSMLPPSMNAYADPSTLSSQPYTVVHQSELRHVSKSSPDPSGFVRDSRSRSSMASAFQSMNTSQSEVRDLQMQRRVSGPSSSMVMAPYDRTKARSEILETFRPFYSDPSITSDPQRHLAVLRSMSDGLPSALKPSKAQLDTPHYYGIDMIASPTLRDRLVTVTTDVARGFVSELGVIGGERGDEVGQVTIWGEDPLNEMSWELSQPLSIGTLGLATGGCLVTACELLEAAKRRAIASRVVICKNRGDSRSVTIHKRLAVKEFLDVLLKLWIDAWKMRGNQNTLCIPDHLLDEALLLTTLPSGKISRLRCEK